MKHSVDAQADQGLLALRLDVDVAGPLIQRIAQQMVDRPHDVAVACVGFSLGAHPKELFEVLKIGQLVQVPLRGRDRAPETVDFTDQVQDLAPTCQTYLQGAAQALTGGLEGLDVERVCCGHGDRVCGRVENEKHVFLGEGSGKGPNDCIRVEPEWVDVDAGHADVVAERIEDLVEL
jgi:hypothetical protein